MNPILYEKTETAFTSSGLGRLVDCIDCVVTEELNTGVYECDFSYPITGEMYDEITLGRIIGVTHDDTGEIQPFDIVSYTKPIDGVVSFHAVHISYRLSRYIAKVQYTVSDVGDAWTMFDNAYPQLIAGRFHYSAPGWTPPTAFMAATADGTPRSVREWIGGVEGGLLDTYGGEILWDKFDVKLLARRGQNRDFLIRYGVNMLDYNETAEGQETYTLAIPFWKNGDVIVVGTEVDSGLTPYDRPLCVAMDLTDKFENAPTTAQLEAEALSIMQSGQTNLPRRTIDVDFVRLQDLEEYSDYDDLLTCELGDSIDVIFPAYNVQGTFRIVKVVWDVLRDRFETMTLGSLQTTLAEALGVGGSVSYSGGGGGGGGSVVSFQQTLSSGTRIGIITIDGTSTDIYAPSGGGGGTGAKIFYGTCSTAAATAAKEVVCSSFTASDLVAGTVLYVDFTYANGKANPTLNVNSTGTKTIYRYGTTAPSTSAASSWNAGAIVCFIYDGSYWNIEGWLNTTYSTISQANIEAQAGTSAGTITGQRFTQGLAARLAISQTLQSGTEIGEITLNGTATKLYAPKPRVWRGASSAVSSETVAARTVTTDTGDFELVAGNIIFVRFGSAFIYDNAEMTLNVDGTGAIQADTSDGYTTSRKFKALETVGFVYNGSRYIMIEDGTATADYYGVVRLSNSTTSSFQDGWAATPKAVSDVRNIADGKSTVSWNQTQETGKQIAIVTINGTPTIVYVPESQTVWYGTQAAYTETTGARTATTVTGDWSLTAGNVIFIKMESTMVAAAPTLNVDGTGAKPVMTADGATVTGQWVAGEVVGFVYDGTSYIMIESGIASTSYYGMTRLSSSHTSTSESRAATPKAVKDAYDLADSKSTVAWNQIQGSSGATKIAEIDIDGTTQDVYAPTGGGGGSSYTATSPINITNNVISHEASGVTAGTYDGGYIKSTGVCYPTFTVDDEGHITAASDFGGIVPLLNATDWYGLITGSMWQQAIRAGDTRNTFGLLSAGQTTATFSYTDSQGVITSALRIYNVSAVDCTTGEAVIVDWTTSAPQSNSSTVTLTVSIASPYSHTILIDVLVGYSNSGH